MKLQDQVCSLELAKKLKELGFKQESLFYFGNTIGQIDQSCWRIQNKDDDTAMEWISAYTVAELGEMLPVEYYSLKVYNQDWYCYKVLEEEDLLFTITGSKTEADARAKMLIYLKENNLI